uniref:Protein kinase domain-containing protein n=1 Tax=Zea mays TaxID=4577 RepID=A0A804Q5F3_MAIZE
MGCCLHRRLCLGGTGTLPFVRRFTAKEVEAATRGFTAVLDAAGTAYRARFAGGLVATVVRRRRDADDNDDHHRQGEGGGGGTTDAFYLELQLLARLNHRHVVRLRGFALAHHARFLVFDHMENRSLKECLHDPLRTPLDWRTRLQVAIDVAAALEYLYYHCDPPVFHVSVNSGTVLMDANFVAKLSDVGVVSHDVRLATTDSFQGLSIRSPTLPTPHDVAALTYLLAALFARLCLCCACRPGRAEAGGPGVPVRRAGAGAGDGAVPGRRRRARALGAGPRLRRLRAPDGGRRPRRRLRRPRAPRPRRRRQALHQGQGRQGRGRWRRHHSADRQVPPGEAGADRMPGQVRMMMMTVMVRLRCVRGRSAYHHRLCSSLTACLYHQMYKSAWLFFCGCPESVGVDQSIEEPK